MRGRIFYRIGITSGDPFGIGPEIVLKSLFFSKRKEFDFVFYGDYEYLSFISKKIGVKIPPNLIVKNVYSVKGVPSKHPSKSGGEYALKSLNEAIKDVREGKISALITSPLSKKGVELNGVRFKGHTEFLAKKFGLNEDDVVMTFFSDRIRVALLTNHIPLRYVHRFIKENLIMKKVKIITGWYEKIFSKTPRIAFLSLNPHKGEDGKEDRIIGKVVKSLKNGEGPFSPDSFFARKIYKDFDFVFAIYHDQGLIPFKILSRGKGCNVTLGLPFLRVSPDHGPAYEIANKGIADIGSMTFCINFISRVIKFQAENSPLSRS